MSSAPSPRRVQAQGLRQALQSLKAEDLVAFHETLAVAAIWESAVSVSLSRPQDLDCPLIGVSAGFEQMTGYSRNEVLGKNCRFLSTGCTVSAEDRHRMRIAVRTGRSFTGVVQNRRKNGEMFMNLLHMSTLRVGKSYYILGIQVDVTGVEISSAKEQTLDEVQKVAEAIFEANVDAWATLQISRYNRNKRGAVPYVELLLRPHCDPKGYNQARDAFVSVERSLLPNHIRDKNTFLEMYDTENDPKVRLMHLRRVFSEPAMPSADPCRQGSLQAKPEAGVRALEREVVKRVLGSSTSSCVEVESVKTLNLSATHADVAASGAKDGGMPSRRLGTEAKDAGDQCSREEQKSLGSAKHPDKCTACSFYCYSLIGCSKGSDCLYCHMRHPKKSHRRRRKHHHRADATGAAEMQAPHWGTLTRPPPAGLLPFLTALELLAPLPAIIALDGRGSRKKATLPGAVDDVQEEELSLSYGEGTIACVVGQCTRVLPFVGGPPKRFTFSICPDLPEGLSLNPSSGVISGLVRKAAQAEHVRSYTVLAEGPSCEARAVVYIAVLASVNEVNGLHGDTASPYVSSEEG